MLRPPFEPFSDWRTSRQGEARFLIDLDAGNRDWKTAFDSLPPFDLRRAAWLTADNLILLFFSLTWPDTDPSLAVGMANYWLRWLWAPLAIACGLVTIAWRRRRR